MIPSLVRMRQRERMLTVTGPVAASGRLELAASHVGGPEPSRPPESMVVPHEFVA